MLYLAVGIYPEEKKLIHEFGDQYIRYKNDMSMLVPRFWNIIDKKTLKDCNKIIEFTKQILGTTKM